MQISISVVKQNYEANVYDEFVIRHNTAVLRCHIPSFVQDYVIVTAWIREDEKGIQSVINSGKNKKENYYCKLSTIKNMSNLQIKNSLQTSPIGTCWILHV